MDVTPIVPPAEKETIKPVQPEQVSQPVSKKTAPVKEKSHVPYLIAVIVVVLLLCGGVILFIYYPDLFSSSSDKNALNMPPVGKMILPDNHQRCVFTGSSRVGL